MTDWLMLSSAIFTESEQFDECLSFRNRRKLEIFVLSLSLSPSLYLVLDMPEI